MRERKSCQCVLMIKRGQKEKEGVAVDIHTDRDSVCVFACMPACVGVSACICETCTLVFIGMFFICWDIVHYCWKTHSCLGL